MHDPARAASAPPERVLVLGGRLPALTALRVLTEAGYHVILGDGGEFSMASRSRFHRESWEHPPATDAEAFTAALFDLLRSRPEVTLLLPVGERYTKALAAIRDSLPEHVTVAGTDPRIIAICTHKDRMYAVAAEVGVQHAVVRSGRTIAEIVSAADDVGYPCIIKPATWSAPMPGGRKAIICHDRDRLDAQLTRWPPGHDRLLVQRYVRGPRYNLHFIADRGRIVQSVQVLHIRSDRWNGTGMGVERRSTPRDARITRATEALLAHLDYTGAGLAQFIVPEDADPYFMEIKSFLGSSHVFAEALGLAQTVASIELARQTRPQRADAELQYVVGRRFAWASRDLYGLMAARADGTVGTRSSLLWLVRLSRSALRADVHATWRWRDPRPTLATYRYLAGQLVRLRRST